MREIVTITCISSLTEKIAYGITFLKGKGGLNGWQWIFVLEGILTILLGVLTWMFVPDFPDKARFLNDNQRKVRNAIHGTLILI